MLMGLEQGRACEFVGGCGIRLANRITGERGARVCGCWN